MILVFGGEKGGTGKSALSINIAVCMRLRGQDVLLIDGDKQRTSAKWAERRAQLAAVDPSQQIVSVPCMERRGDMLAALESLAPKYDHIIIDVAGAESPQLGSALMAADRLYSPFVPSEADLETAEAIGHAIDLTRHRGNPDLQSWAVLNQVSPRVHERDNEQQLARELLEPFAQLPIASAVLYQRNIFRKAHSARRGVVELAESKSSRVRAAAAQATAELWALYSEITGDVVAPAVVEEIHDEAAV